MDGGDTVAACAVPSGGSISPLEAHADFLLVLIADQPDLTLEAMRKRRIAGSRIAAWRFFERHSISLKKTISDGVAPVGMETLGLYPAHGRERPSACFFTGSLATKKQPDRRTAEPQRSRPETPDDTKP